MRSVYGDHPGPACPRIFSTALGWTHPRQGARLKDPFGRGFLAKKTSERISEAGTWLPSQLFPPAPTRSIAAFPSGWTRVIKALENVRSSPDADAVHDLRVAIRRCRSVAAVMEEVDSPTPLGPPCARSPAKLFRGLGALRDAQVMDEWSRSSFPKTDPVRTHLQTAFESNEPKLRENALRVAGKFDQKSWKRLERTVHPTPPDSFPSGSLAAECLALRTIRKRQGSSRESPAHGKIQTLSRAAHWTETLPLLGREPAP